MSFKGWGSVLPDRFVYRSVRAVVRAMVWSVLAVVLLGWGIAGVWFVWGVVK